MAELECLMQAIWCRVDSNPNPKLARPVDGRYVSFPDGDFGLQIGRLVVALALAATDRLPSYDDVHKPDPEAREALVYVPSNCAAKLDRDSGPPLLPSHHVAFQFQSVAFVQVETGAYECVLGCGDLIEMTVAEIASWFPPIQYGPHEPIQYEPVEDPTEQAEPTEPEQAEPTEQARPTEPETTTAELGAVALRWWRHWSRVERATEHEIMRARRRLAHRRKRHVWRRLRDLRLALELPRLATGIWNKDRLRHALRVLRHPATSDSRDRRYRRDRGPAVARLGRTALFRRGWRQLQRGLSVSSRPAPAAPVQTRIRRALSDWLVHARRRKATRYWVERGCEMAIAHAAKSRHARARRHRRLMEPIRLLGALVEAGRAGRRRRLRIGLARLKRWAEGAGFWRRAEAARARRAAARVIRSARVGVRAHEVARRRLGRLWRRFTQMAARDRPLPEVVHPRSAARRYFIRILRVHRLPSKLDQLRLLRREVERRSEQPLWVQTFMGPYTPLVHPLLHFVAMSMFRLLRYVVIRGDARRHLQRILDAVRTSEAKRMLMAQDEDWYRCACCTGRLLPRDARALTPKRRRNVTMRRCATCDAVYCSQDCLAAHHQASRFLVCSECEHASDPTLEPNMEGARNDALAFLTFYMDQMLERTDDPLLIFSQDPDGSPMPLKLDHHILRLGIGALAMRAAANDSTGARRHHEIIGYIAAQLPTFLMTMRLTNRLYDVLPETIEEVSTGPMPEASEESEEASDESDESDESEESEASGEASQPTTAAWRRVLMCALHDEHRLRGRVAMRALVSAMFARGIITAGPDAFPLGANFSFYKRAEPCCNSAADLCFSSDVQAVLEQAAQVIWSPVTSLLYGQPTWTGHKPVHHLFSVNQTRPHPVLQDNDTRRGYGPLVGILNAVVRVGYAPAPQPALVGVIQSAVAQLDPLDGQHPFLNEIMTLLKSELLVQINSQPWHTLVTVAADRETVLSRMLRCAGRQEELADSLLNDLTPRDSEGLADMCTQALEDMSGRAVFGVLRLAMYASTDSVDDVATGLAHCALATGLVDLEHTPSNMHRVRSIFIMIEHNWPRIVLDLSDPVLRAAHILTADWHNLCRYGVARDDQDLLALVLYDRLGSGAV